MELDTRDRKLLYSMDFSARQPLSQIARSLRISKQALTYRLERLEKENIIQGYYCDINPSKIGLTIYLVYFKFHKLSPDKEKNFTSFLTTKEGVGVNVSLQGEWDYCIGIWAKDIFHFKRLYRETMKHYETYVKEKRIMIETDFFYFKPQAILNLKENKQITMEGSMEVIEIDAIDQEIIRSLSKNARISLVELAQKTHLSPNAIKARIKYLEKEKIILGYRVMINYQVLGFLHHRIFLHLENITEDKEKKIIHFLKSRKEVLSVTKTIGFCELEFRSITLDIHEHYKLLEELKTAFPDTIKSHNSVIYYKFHQTLNYFPF